MNLKLSPSKDSPANSRGRSPETTIASRASLRSRSLSFWLQRPLITQTKVIETVSGGLSKVRLEMIEACGRLCQLLGLPRTTGQIRTSLSGIRTPVYKRYCDLFTDKQGQHQQWDSTASFMGGDQRSLGPGGSSGLLSSSGGTERFDPWSTQRFYKAQIEFLS